MIPERFRNISGIPAFAAICVALGWVSGAIGQVPVAVQIRTDDPAQEIRGFGASGCWWFNWFDRLSAEQQETALDLLFTDAGAGLDIYRCNLPSASGEDVLNRFRRSTDIETTPLAYDITRDATNLDLLERVVSRGVDDVTFFANSPPRRLTRNGKTSGGDDGLSNLAEGSEGEFARYLVDVTGLYMERAGLNHARLSPINEPQWKWGQNDRRRWQEGCHYTPAQAAEMAHAVAAEIDQSRVPGGPRINLEVFDSGSWKATPKYAEAVWDQPGMTEAAPAIAIHSYWSSAADKRATRAWLDEHLPDATLYMTEYCEMRGGHDPTMESGLHVARVIHEDLTIGRVSEWTWWLGMSSSRFCDGLIHAWLKRGEIETTKRLWVMGHWARFVEPGATRVSASVDQESELLVTAFTNLDSQDVVCVLVNPADSAVTAELVLDGDSVDTTEAWVTDERRDLQKVESGLLVPARGLMTVVVHRERTADS